MKTLMSLEEASELQRMSSLNAMKRIESSYILIFEMKRLFAFMTKSEKKYTNPTRMISKIVDDFGNPMKIGDQQDISEVSEGFMTRVHEGIQAIMEPIADKSEPSPFSEETKAESDHIEIDDENHINNEESKMTMLEQVENYAKNAKLQGFIKNLYYGLQVETTECQTEQGHDTIEESDFLMILLNLEHSNNLYEAWDKAYRYEVDTGNKTLQKKRWITKAPDVLTFNIIRVVYDHETMMPTKLHDEFTFDKEIYIDRFIAKNASRFPDFMSKLDKLKSKKQALEESLKRYQFEGKSYMDYLKVARKFIEVQKKVKEEDKEAEAPDEHDMTL